MTEDNLKLLMKLKNSAMSFVNGNSAKIDVVLDDREFCIDGEQAAGVAKGILLVCKCFEMQEGI